MCGRGGESGSAPVDSCLTLNLTLLPPSSLWLHNNNSSLMHLKVEDTPSITCWLTFGSPWMFRWLEKTLRAHQRCISSVHHTAGGLVTAGKDGFVKLWSTQLAHLRTFDLNEVTNFRAAGILFSVLRFHSVLFRVLCCHGWRQTEILRSSLTIDCRVKQQRSISSPVPQSQSAEKHVRGSITSIEEYCCHDK